MRRYMIYQDGIKNPWAGGTQREAEDGAYGLARLLIRGLQYGCYVESVWGGGRITEYIVYPPKSRTGLGVGPNGLSQICRLEIREIEENEC